MMFKTACIVLTTCATLLINSMLIDDPSAPECQLSPMRTAVCKTLLMLLVNYELLFHKEEQHAWKEGIVRNLLIPFGAEFEKVYKYRLYH